MSDWAIWTIRMIACSISSSDVEAPKLKRIDDRSRSFGTCMAVKVGEGWLELLAQAEPREAATPARSSCIRRASPSIPGNPRLTV